MSPGDPGAAAHDLALQAGPPRTTLRVGRLPGVFVDVHEAWHGVHFLLPTRTGAGPGFCSACRGSSRCTPAGACAAPDPSTPTRWGPRASRCSATTRGTLEVVGEAELAGEFFEREDQRNNADAPFKTDSRYRVPLHPYRLQAGAVVRPSVRLRVASRPTGRPRNSARSPPDCVLRA